MAHTPTPWHIERESDEYTLRGANREWIANNTNYYPSAPTEDDAEFIVTACNAYDANQSEIASLRETLAWVRMNYAGGSTREINARIEAALEPKP